VGLFPSFGRWFVRNLDAVLRRAYGIYDFNDSPDCILRVEHLRHAQKHVELSDGRVINVGDPICIFHLWSERIPSMGPAGPDLEWAIQMRRGFMRSLNLLQAFISNHQEYAEAKALFAYALFPVETLENIRQIFHRMGFDTFYVFAETPGQRFGLWWQRFYGRWLLWTFQPASLRAKDSQGHWAHLELWLPRPIFEQNFGSTNPRWTF
jgi:hypothetical protein